MWFNYAFGSILQLDNDDKLYKVFKSNNFTRMKNIISIKDDGFEKLQYIDENRNKDSHLEPFLLRLRIMKAFYFYLLDKHELYVIDWKDESIVSADIFDDFRISMYNMSAPTNPKNLSQVNANNSTENNVQLK